MSSFHAVNPNEPESLLRIPRTGALSLSVQPSVRYQVRYKYAAKSAGEVASADGLTDGEALWARAGELRQWRSRGVVSRVTA